MKQSEYNNFIGLYDNYFSNQFCDNLIEFFHFSLKNNRVWGRQETSSLLKKDSSTICTPITIEELSFKIFPMRGVIEEFNSVFWDECYSQYATEYEVLKDYEKHTIRDYKLQKTSPSGGYHIWHSETAGVNMTRRIATYILYLNDIEAGGETEFLYQSLRIPAKKGRLCIFPAYYTHTHRGNPPLSGDKYIMTGWIEFA